MNYDVIKLVMLFGEVRVDEGIWNIYRNNSKGDAGYRVAAFYDKRQISGQIIDLQYRTPYTLDSEPAVTCNGAE